MARNLPTNSHLHLLRVPLAALATLVLLAGCVNADQGKAKAGDDDSSADTDSGTAHSINGSIHVTAAQKNGDVATVNGSIRVDDNAVLTGANTVNGSIAVGAHASADQLNTVNGGILLRDGAHVAHMVNTVNGGVTLATGADVGGELANVNGKIELQAAHVGGGIKTVNGDIDVGSNSRIEGGIHVTKGSQSWFNFGGNHKPRIVIGPGAVVQGELRFERDVDLYVSDKATIGPVTGATPVRFSGDNPPAG